MDLVYPPPATRTTVRSPFVDIVMMGIGAFHTPFFPFENSGGGRGIGARLAHRSNSQPIPATKLTLRLAHCTTRITEQPTRQGDYQIGFFSLWGVGFRSGFSSGGRGDLGGGGVGRFAFGFRESSFWLQFLRALPLKGSFFCLVPCKPQK